MSDDPLRGIDFSERIKPLMQEMVLLDQKRMEEIAALRQQLRGAVEENENLRLQVAALENDGIELAAKLGEAEEQIARLTTSGGQ